MNPSELIKELREKTGAGMLECRNALVEASNDIEKAADLLRKRGIAKAAKREGRRVAEGLVHSYIHSNYKVGVLLELNCETDFVSKTDEFKSLIHEISLHIAATNPKYISKTDVLESDLDRERDIIRTQAESSGKKGPVLDKIVEGKLNKFYEENCLLLQPFVKDPDKNIETLIKETMAKLGENITVRRFSRFQVGEKS